jgi:hypothetical protein
MSVPPSVARRAYQTAAAGGRAEFFYVRRFVSDAGARDQYVAVRCRLTGGRASVPLSLVDVVLAYGDDSTIAQVAAGDPPPAIVARLGYTGSGRLTGRWEVVLPGQDFPVSADLLSEAALPLEVRTQQRRYLELERFSVFLPPGGRFVLPGPDPRRIPTSSAGQHLVLLRIEPSDDLEAGSDLRDVGAGDAFVRAGAVAGFPMPVLRYLVGPPSSTAGQPTPAALAAPLAAGEPIDLRWESLAGVACYRLEIESGAAALHQALLAPAATSYRVPPFVADRAVRGEIRWRLVGIGADGVATATGDWQRVVIGARDR